MWFQKGRSLFPFLFHRQYTLSVNVSLNTVNNALALKILTFCLDNARNYNMPQIFFSFFYL